MTHFRMAPLRARLAVGTAVLAGSLSASLLAQGVNEYPLPGAALPQAVAAGPAGSGPQRIVSGPDGNLWFTEHGKNKIGRLTTGGSFTEFPIPTPNVFPEGIAAGPDGNLWFSENAGNRIGRVTTAGAVTEFLLPVPARVFQIAAGPDGNLWFTEYDN